MSNYIFDIRLHKTRHDFSVVHVLYMIFISVKIFQLCSLSNSSLLCFHSVNNNANDIWSYWLVVDDLVGKLAIVVPDSSCFKLSVVLGKNVFWVFLMTSVLLTPAWSCDDL